MSHFDIITPDLPESVADATVVKWHKAVGDDIKRDDILVEVETDKVVLEVPALDSGVLESIDQPEGATVVSKQLLGRVAKGETVVAPVSAQPLQTESRPAPDHHDSLGPSVRRLVGEHDLNPQDISGSGKHGRITREDVAQALADKEAQSAQTAVKNSAEFRDEQRVPMTRLRKRIAERLLEVKNTTAMLTTFNEVDMQPIMQLRKKYGEKFEKQHDVRLGFMSFYVKAVVEALKRYPVINATIDGDDILYHNYFDISIAVSTPRGLVTPVLRDCDKMSMADIEKQIKVLAEKGRDGKLTVEDLTGGNFTITNGGVFGSLMSTPIINPPQSAILGMHTIKDRPVAVDGQVVIRPMMYLALSYDHRLIDGKDSVRFLVTIKDLLEDPTRLLLEI
ncbi:dihydrolipoamide succinyltransferase [Actinobacillus succinogenes]|uniref:Dihydrolipoyllysine-residue succinyltransferase component of 2-oxoglutarate dehydrogenase complex n=1 Tax=Actinobacillus succinogenes (strain ATCC 55618 / DSM 22257 / CCUG 43843 / 130Z) TaxID=339671 RepID=A6VPM3_ACTSZ|nr:2-oxoglutarate dehydrogenase complex dihydrolipoyllysine-residue succinyltransferase [Actinobacillus succinogenes]ABR74920.1 2-oxoglutarate dehydrogenase, E2 subunit, dihydrolipoamide succinyltransferase [Actinobacillus succinogenes 130Z]PHI40669.1 dihydrolipoamide succinyltransferase [Actinobacillus succinogenes]